MTYPIPLENVVDGMGWDGWIDGMDEYMGWMDGTVIIGHRSSKSTFSANKTDDDDDTQWLVTFLEALGCLD